MGLFKDVSTALSPIFKPAGTLIEGVLPGSWASPQNPIRPTTQLGVGIRAWDFTPGINQQFTPRGDVSIKFNQLWNVSNSFDLCRLMIETRKDQIVNRPWQIRVKPKPGEKKSERLKREAGNTNVTALTQLLRYPDGIYSFDLWIRMWLEDLLVFDAPCISPMRSLGGDVLSLPLVSGSTITPLLDQYGRRPAPPSPAYQQIILGIPTSNLADTSRQFIAAGKGNKPGDAQELVYSPRNPRVNSRWGLPPVEQIVTTLSIAANRQQFLLDFYTAGNVPEGLLPMPESWTMKQIKDFQMWFDGLLAGNLGKRRRLTMIPDAKHEPTMTKHEALTDVTDDYLIRVVAFAFSITPQNLIKQVNRGTAKESSDVAQIEGLEPYLKHIENTLNGIIERVFGFDDVEFAYQDEREMDPEKQALVDKIYIDGGTYTRNEVRESRGDDPRPEKEADMLGITTPTGFVPLDATAAADRAQSMQPPEKPPGEAKPAQSAKVRKASELRAVAGQLTPRNTQIRYQFAQYLTKFLGAQRKSIARQCLEEYTVAKAASKQGKLSKGDTEEDTKKAAAILALLKWGYGDLADSAKGYLEDAAKEGAQVGAYQISSRLGAPLTGTVATAQAEAAKAATARAYEMVGLKVADDGTIAEATGPHWAISTTAKDDVLNAIAQAIREEWTPTQLQAVVEAINIFTPEHADMIADSEISHQQVQGHLAAWRVSGKVLEYSWTVMDLGCCPLCAEFSLQGSVPVGHCFGMDIYEPGAHPACRCWLTVTKLADEEED